MKNFLLICAFFSLVSFFLVSSCERQIDPSITMVIPIDTNPDGGTKIVSRTHKLSGKIFATGSVSGGMVLIPTFDSTYLVDTTTYHSASGFIDEHGDTAFVTEPFLMDTAEVTKAEWMAVMRDSTDSIPRNHPKTRISWFDAVRYCMKRTTAAGLTQVYDTFAGWESVGPTVNWNATGFRLPTEDEWEYAAKGGERNHRYGTSTGLLAPHLANYGSDKRLDTSNLSYDLALRKTLFSSDIRTQYLPSAVNYLNTFIKYSGRPDTLQSSTNYIRSYSPTKNSFLRTLKYPIFLDTSVKMDTNILIKHDTAWLINDSFKVDLVNDARHWYYKRNYLYVFSRNYPVPRLDTLKITVFDSSIYFYTAPVESIPGVKITQFNGVALKSDTSKSEVVTDTSSKARTIKSILKTVYPFTYNDSFFIESRTSVTTIYDTASLELYGFSDKSTFPANSFRLRDMSGNASEWCNDGYINMQRGYRIDVRNNNNSSTKVHRGGNAVSNDETGGYQSIKLATSERESANPLLRFTGIGFRCVRRAP